MRPPCWVVLLAFGVPGMVVRLAAAPDLESLTVKELKQIPLENLLVTSVSKKSEKVFEAPAAVSVITEDEIRRSGVRTLAEALRLVPGTQVAHLDANTWAISARGFSDRFANKLLVLIDGRVVYTPVFGGVVWHDQDTLLADIDRIEVVRGPGGTLWGANAVNGVINIITKDARATQDGYASGGYGTEEQGFGAVRYGHRVGETGYLRTYFKYDNHDTFAVGPDDQGHDDWRTFRGGFRSDWHLLNDQITFQGDYYYGDFGGLITRPTFTPPFARILTDDTTDQGGNGLFRWTHLFEDGSDFQLQTYFDHWNTRSPTLDYTLDTWDIDFQHRFHLPWRQEFLYGLGYRLLPDDSENFDPSSTFIPPSRNQQLFSAFVQDEITLVEDRLRLILGSKFEHTDYTGFEIQPNARLLWLINTNQTAWGSISRAVRTPSRTERDLAIDLLPSPGPGGIMVYPRGVPTSDFESEDLLAYELGYRVKPIPTVSFDISAFYFDYEDLGTAQTGAPFLEPTPGVPHLVVPLSAVNEGHGYAYGFEISAEVELDDWWRVRGGYSLVEQDLEGNTFAGGAKDPPQQFFARSSMDFPGNVELDFWFRYVDEIAALNVSSYVELDVRLGWKPHKNVELAIVGQNLIHDQHQEFGEQLSFSSQITQVERGVYGQVTVRF